MMEGMTEGAAGARRIGHAIYDGDRQNIKGG
jgi:hypothetical protein